MRTRAWFGVVIVALVAACSGGGGGSTTPTTSAAATSTSSSTVASTTSAGATTSTTTLASTTTGAVTTTSRVTTTTSAVTTTSPATTTTGAARVDVRTYFVRSDRLVIAHRAVAGPAVLRGALEALLAGPSDAERAAGTTTVIPAGTTLRDVRLADATATVDLGAAFASGGGSFSMQARVGQVVFTATQFSTVERVVLLLEGRPITALGGEGLVLTDPQTRVSIDRALTGGVLVDAPAPGATVRRTFTVTGEGDVYEAQFPIEVWAGGRLVVTVAPVTAGAWGTWRTFRVTVTVPAEVPDGPIELVAYDEGGCGTAPECPPIVRTVVPLVLAA